MSATEKVFSSPELTESILLQLPLQSLLLSQRVCQLFQLVITTSPALQEALFFKAKQRKTSNHKSISKPSVNPLLFDRFSIFFDIKYNYGRPVMKGNIDFAKLDWAAAKADESGNDKRVDAYKRRDASWRSMLMTQPPPQFLIINEVRHAMGGDSCQTAKLDADQRGHNFTMGELWDFIQNDVRVNWIARGFAVDWCMFDDHQDLLAHVPGLCDILANRRHAVSCKPDTSSEHEDGDQEMDDLSWHRDEELSIHAQCIDAVEVTFKETVQCSGKRAMVSAKSNIDTSFDETFRSDGYEEFVGLKFRKNHSLMDEGRYRGRRGPPESDVSRAVAAAVARRLYRSA